MALKAFPRQRVPLDGTWFRTLAHLDGILHGMRDKADEGDYRWPDVQGSWVPIWVSMEPCQESWLRLTNNRAYPHGIIYRPVVKLGDFCSPEIRGLSDYAANLCRNSELDSWESGNCWHYTPHGYTWSGCDVPPGEDSTIYECDICHETLQRDDNSDRMHGSATIWDGGLVCRNCEVPGLVMHKESREQLERARKLAAFVGDEARRGLARQIEYLSDPRDYNRQVRLWTEDKFSFFWQENYLIDGVRKRGMHGGLIMHGPGVEILDDGTYQFTDWDHSVKPDRDDDAATIRAKCLKPATEERIKGIRWSIHT